MKAIYLLLHLTFFLFCTSLLFAGNIGGIVFTDFDNDSKEMRELTKKFSVAIKEAGQSENVNELIAKAKMGHARIVVFKNPDKENVERVLASAGLTVTADTLDIVAGCWEGSVSDTEGTRFEFINLKKGSGFLMWRDVGDVLKNYFTYTVKLTN